MNAKLEELRVRLGEISDFNAAAAVLRWDQQTYMPPAGAEARATQLATLSKTAHARLTSDEIGALLEDLEAEAAALDYDSYKASLLRATRRRYDQQRRVPAELVAELSRARALGNVAWQQARAESSFAHFQPHLEKIVNLTIQKAEALGYEDRIYDALLDQYEPQMKAAQVETLFDEMKAGLLPLIRAIAEREARAPIDDSMLGQEFEDGKQWEFGIEVLKRIGFDFTRGRQDRSAHPFTTGFSWGDVRLTTRVFPRQLKAALFASIHEAGHGMYRQGIDRALERSPLSDAASLGVHESQSRMWENVVGRSRGFWSFWLPRLQSYFPAQLGGVGLDAFYRAINRVQSSPIRVEADEVTYNLHIFIRFEIENMMVERRVKVGDLPELWNAKTEEYLGFRPENDAQGVLQDTHWGGGMIGYFPTYSLGNLLAVQFYQQAAGENPDIPAGIEAGEFQPLLSWLRGHIHIHGGKYTPAELVQRVTGGPIRTQPFLDYVRAKYTEIYNL
jgi:carboxypeptidase Taq